MNGVLRPYTAPDFGRFAGLVAELESWTPEQAEGMLGLFRNQLGAGFGDLVLLAEARGDLRGAVLLRPSPHHGYELVGGARPGPDRAEVGRLLLDTAQERASQAGSPGTYTFALKKYWPLDLLTDLGFRPVAQAEARRLSGPVGQAPPLPAGFQIMPYTERPDLGLLVQGERFYEDMWGHHLVDPEQYKADFDPQALHVLLFDDQNQLAGVCSAGVDGPTAWVSAPGIRPDVRTLGLQAPLLAHTTRAVQHLGVQTCTLQSWGEAPDVSEQYGALGFELIEAEVMVAR